MVCNFPSKARRRGFTLLEVMAAVAVLGTALFVLLESHYASLRLNETVAEEVYFRQLLETVVAKAEVEVLAGNYTDAGDFGSRYPDYTWSFDAAQFGEDELILLYRVGVTVHAPDEERSLEFYLYDTGMGSGEEDSASSSQASGGSGASGTNRGAASTAGTGFLGGR